MCLNWFWPPLNVSAAEYVFRFVVVAVVVVIVVVIAVVVLLLMLLLLSLLLLLLSLLLLLLLLLSLLLLLQFLAYGNIIFSGCVPINDRKKAIINSHPTDQTWSWRAVD